MLKLFGNVPASDSWNGVERVNEEAGKDECWPEKFLPLSFRFLPLNVHQL